MPELPEVETTCRGIRPHLLAQTVAAVVVRNRQLRWPVPAGLGKKLTGEKIEDIARRGKYILLTTAKGAVLIHLGMSGSLRIVDAGLPPRKHDHLDLVLGNGKCLRLHDPRRFGSVLWAGKTPLQHKLLARLGPEPFGNEFNADYLYTKSRKRSQSIKTFIMDSHLVVGVGNIYASESLYRSGIHPRRAAGRISLLRYEKLVSAIQGVLRDAIQSGGSTLRDFVNEEGAPGYFTHKLDVYGRSGQPCHGCGQLIRQITVGQRSTYYCVRCQC